MPGLIEKILSVDTNVWAVIDESNDCQKKENKISGSLKKRGHIVYGVNPKTKIIKENLCYESIRQLPQQPDIIIIIAASPQVTEKLLKEAIGQGIKTFWLQPGAGSKQTLEMLMKTEGVEFVYNHCIREEIKKSRLKEAFKLLKKFIKRGI